MAQEFSWGAEGDVFASDNAPDTLPEEKRRDNQLYPTLIVAGLCVIGLALSFSVAGGYFGFVMTLFGYVTAVIADLRARQASYAVRRYERPKLTSNLRAAAFAVALISAWAVSQTLIDPE